MEAASLRHGGGERPAASRPATDRPLHACVAWAGWAVFWLLYAVVPLALARDAVLPDLPLEASLAGLIALRMASGLTASCLLHVVCRRPTVQRLPGASSLAAVAAACVVVAAIEAVVREPLMAWLTPALLPHVQPLWLQVTAGFTVWLFIWSLLDRVVRHQRVVAAAEVAARDARLAAAEAALALKSSELARLAQQVHPHFLFNALAAVVGCRHDAEHVAEVVNALADYLRFCLTRSGRNEPLGQELDAIEKLLTVEQARFGAAIECRIDATTAARARAVPPMIVGPLVENAVKFGRLTSPTPLVITVDARLEGLDLVVTVTNSGSWVEENHPARTGTGLDNLRRRLELADLPAAVLQTAVTDGRVSARLTLPTEGAGGRARVADGGNRAGRVHTVAAGAR